MNDREVVGEVTNDVTDSADEQQCEYDHADFAGGGLLQLLVKKRASGYCGWSCHGFVHLVREMISR